ncbi:NAD(P)-dependent oxidoreductase [Sphingobacterium gobiense]|uniref:Epimerase n=1 Tax=Sphingobacterium gobiense TaxID=1382456 RepID=A0A2S9JV26_9SPHI|nr:SDR family oxidoreductase [Sphingobacterium gobiense]PRD57127.1 epimerase [Sphingobacterium gobiense]
MKIIVFGATGTVGTEIVKQALEKGYGVTAFVRNPEKIIALNHPNLHVYTGDVSNADDVKRAVKDHNAIFCALGDGRAGKIRALGTLNIIHAMNSVAVRKLICLSTLGMGESYGNLNFIWKHIMFGMLLKRAFNDHKLQEEYIHNSNLDFTIVRPSALTGGAVTNGYKIGFDGKYKKLNLRISRADVADFMLCQLHTESNVGKAVSISN